MLNDSIEMAQMDNECKESCSANDKPAAFEAGEWIKWWESKLVDYFHSVYNTKNIPFLSYVLRKDATKEHHEMSCNEQVIYSSAALEGPLFDVDMKDVLRIIKKELTTGMPAEAWVKNMITCGRIAMERSSGSIMMVWLRMGRES